MVKLRFLIFSALFLFLVFIGVLTGVLVYVSNNTLVVYKCCTEDLERECSIHGDCKNVCVANNTYGFVCKTADSNSLKSLKIGQVTFPEFIFGPETKTYPDCITDSKTDAFHSANCLTNNPIAFAFGDSHTLQIVKFLEAQNVSIAIRSAPGNHPVYSSTKFFEIMTKWSNSFDFVIIALHWSWQPIVDPSICDSVKWVKNVFIPQMPINQTLLLVGNLPYFQDIQDYPFIHRSLLMQCNILLKQLVSKNVKYWDYSEAFCPLDFCSPWMQYRPQNSPTGVKFSWYRDQFHLSQFGSNYLPAVVSLPFNITGRVVKLPKNVTVRSYQQIVEDKFSLV
jgi:hypothetical protein